MTVKGCGNLTNRSRESSYSSSPEKSNAEIVGLSRLIKRASEDSIEASSPLKQRTITPTASQEEDPPSPKTPNTVERAPREIRDPVDPVDPVFLLTQAHNKRRHAIDKVLLDLAKEQGILSQEDFEQYNSLLLTPFGQQTPEEKTFIKEMNKNILPRIQVDGIGGPVPPPLPLGPRELFPDVEGGSTLSSSAFW